MVHPRGVALNTNEERIRGTCILRQAKKRDDIRTEFAREYDLLDCAVRVVSFPNRDRVEWDAIAVRESNEFTDFGAQTILPFSDIAAIKGHRGLRSIHELAMVVRGREGWFGVGHWHVDRFSSKVRSRIMPFESLINAYSKNGGIHWINPHTAYFST